MMSPFRRYSAPLGYLCLAALAFLLYVPALSFELTFDDPFLIETVEQVTRERGIAGLFLTDYKVDYYATEKTGYYRPAPLVSLYLDRLLADHLPSVFHLTNIILHTINTLLVCYFLTLIQVNKLPVFLATAVFAAHPVHVESVASVAGRTDLLAATFLLSSVVFWLRSSFPSRMPVGRYSIAALTFLFALLSKEISLLLPPVLLFLGGLRGDRSESMTAQMKFRNLLSTNRQWIAVWTATYILYFILRFRALGIQLGRYGTEASSSIWFDPSNLITKLLVYCRLTLVPWPLNAYYSGTDVTLSPVTLLASFTLISAFAAVSFRPSSRQCTISGAWFLAFLAPALGLVPIMGSEIAERFLYVPSVGFSILIGCAMEKVDASGTLRRWSLILVAALTMLYASGTAIRLPVWKNNVALGKSMVEASPLSEIAHLNLGVGLNNSGNPSAALVHFTKACQLNPYRALNHYNLGITYDELERTGEAMEAFRKAIELDAGYSLAYLNLGVQYGKLGLFQKAIPLFKQTLHLTPGQVLAHKNLGAAYANLGLFEQSIHHYLNALGLNPRDPEIHFYLALSYISSRRIPEALRERDFLMVASPDLAAALDDRLGRTSVDK